MDTCINQLACVLDRNTLKENLSFINRVREARHLRVLEKAQQAMA